MHADELIEVADEPEREQEQCGLVLGVFQDGGEEEECNREMEPDAWHFIYQIYLMFTLFKLFAGRPF